MWEEEFENLHDTLSAKELPAKQGLTIDRNLIRDFKT